MPGPSHPSRCHLRDTPPLGDTLGEAGPEELETWAILLSATRAAQPIPAEGRKKSLEELWKEEGSEHGAAITTRSFAVQQLWYPWGTSQRQPRLCGDLERAKHTTGAGSPTQFIITPRYAPKCNLAVGFPRTSNCPGGPNSPKISKTASRPLSIFAAHQESFSSQKYPNKCPEASRKKGSQITVL
ncbi:hypothetical protein B0T14DRAFT_550027 [Immersiella caudata]|uniref:Uncharacterized protein n=1 Tax=Immersiella caudata TaxID=314043 RepID=A0AA39XF15_9PEZI|nr:hypothetical protein B0T14DRAFT_550027 [Immersiella caudata]